jgi:hypothetical protein
MSRAAATASLESRAREILLTASSMEEVYRALEKKPNEVRGRVI